MERRRVARASPNNSAALAYFVLCPRCGHDVVALAICPACDYVVDTSFLGSDFLDESTRADVEAGVDVTEPVLIRASTPSPFGPDPLLLGDPTAEVNQFFTDKSDGFLTAKTSDGLRHVLPAAFYIGGDVQQCLAPDAVLDRVHDAEQRSLRMSPFELVVWRQINGQRPVARIEALMGLDASDVHMALALLVDKRMIHRIGTATASAFDEHTNAEPIDPAVPAGRDHGFDEPSPFGDAGSLYLRLPTGVLDLPTGAISILQPAPTAPELSKPATTVASEMAIERVAVPTPQDEALRASSWYEQCLSDLDAGNIARAYNFLRMAVETDANNAVYRDAMMGWDALVTARQRGPDQNRWFAEALQAEQEGRHDKAIELLQLAAARTPNSAALWNRLGVLLATRRKDVQGALDALGKAIELEPSNPAYMNNFGKIAALSERAHPPNQRPASRLSRWFGK
jgi:tetratricopeptide (TPR) repeat protein